MYQNRGSTFGTVRRPYFAAIILVTMTLSQNKTAFRRATMMIAAIGGLALAGGVAQASVIPISFTTSGIFSSGTPAEISYIPTSFSGSTSESGNLVLPNIGEFVLGATADPEHFNGSTFTLHLEFLSPLGVINPVDFVASLSGHINRNGNGNVHVNFTPGSNVFTFANSTSSGTFTLSVNDVTGLQPNDTLTATGNITGASNPPAAAPEPGSFVLLGSALIALSYTVRRKTRLQ